MKFIVRICCLLLFLYGGFLHAQFNCAGIEVSPIAKDKIETPSALSSSSPKFVKIYFHVYTNGGNSTFSTSQLDAIVADLNGYFSGTSFSFFYSPCEVREDPLVNLYTSIIKCDFFFGPHSHSDGIDIHLRNIGSPYMAVASGIPGSEIIVGGYNSNLGVSAYGSAIIAHEMGHALGLLHTFSGTCNEQTSDCPSNEPYWVGTDPNGDYVSDTPEDENDSFDNINSSCEWNGQGCADDGQDPGHLRINYMAYTQVSCMSEFTAGQNTKMCNDALPQVIYDAPEGPYSADYTIVNVNGTAQLEFCKDDKIYLDGAISENEDMYSIEILEYNLGGYEAGESPLASSTTNPLWINGTVPDGISLQDIWANNVTYEFRQGYEYRVVLRVNGDCDDYEDVKEDGIFTILLPTPDYIFTDKNGNPKDEFCLGERIFLDGSASYNDSKYFLAIWQYVDGTFDPDDPGSNNIGYSRLEPSWAQGEVPSQINLLTVWDNFESDYFAPGYEYAVQLAVQNDCDQGWYSKFDASFRVICCSDQDACNAGFKVEEDGSEFVLNASIDRPYYEHGWTIMHSSNSTDPDDLEVMATGAGSSMILDLTMPGFYIVQHIVTTPCGSCCVAKEIEITSTPNGPVTMISDVPCIDTEDYCHLTAPQNPSCSAPNGLIELSWDPVVDADSYRVILTFDDPDCCETSREPTSSFFDVQTPPFTLNFSPRCASWKVQAICSDGKKSEFSEKQCIDQCGSKFTDGEPEELVVRQADHTLVSIYPNPTSQQFYLEIDQALFDEGIVDIYLTDLSGKLIQDVSVDHLNAHVPNALEFEWQQASGVYFLSIKTRQQMMVKRILLMR